MNFKVFSVDTTNLFPAANLTSGGQLVTEWNMRSREMVATDPAVTYEIGPSFVHGEQDFEVSLLSEGGVATSSTTLQIAEGRAVINGHYFESLTAVSIDLAAENAKLAQQSRELLRGQLAVGIRAYYATEETIAGSIIVDNEQDMLLGVQIIILPIDEMVTPSDSPLDKSKVTADIVLAEFTYLNNSITNIINSPTKLQYLTSDRVKDLETIVSNKYITKTGLNSKKLYAFAGKGQDPVTGLDTWEDVTDSMIVWDRFPERVYDEPSFKQATFLGVDAAVSEQYRLPQGVSLILPHKQVTGMTTDQGDPEYYAPKVISMPQAEYSTCTPGVVTPSYTRKIQDIANKVNDFRNSLTGKQVMFMDTRTITTQLPKINEATWNIGDYLLVKNDDYIVGGQSSTESSPATMYVVLPGEVLTVGFIAKTHGNADVDPSIPDNILGAELGFQEWYQSAGQSLPDTEHPEYYPQFYDEGYAPRGIPYNAEEDKWYDYFRIRYYYASNESEYADESYPFDDFYYGVATSGPRSWSDAVMVTGSVALATENTIGGFYNVNSQSTDYGYVYLDDTGHLRLLDYELLRSGTLAYQLGSDISIPQNTALTEIQNYLYEYVNNRIAFPPGSQISSIPAVIHVYIPIVGTDEGGVLEIDGIDSRFNTAVCIHIQGDAGPNVTINIRDCQKLMIDPSIQGTPVINVFRTCLRYDPEVFNYIRTCERDTETYGTFKGMRDISLWYERLEDTDPVLTVNDMTVAQLDFNILLADIDYWKELYAPVVNDNNYLVALKSVTFSSEGDIIGCEVLAANNSTDNIVVGEKIIVGDTVLPQGSSLVYPTACLTRMLKVTGTFTSAYHSEDQWYVTDTSFTLLSGTYDELNPTAPVKGQVAFHSRTSLVLSTLEQTSIAGWEPDSYHVFQGGSIN